MRPLSKVPIYMFILYSTPITEAANLLLSGLFPKSRLCLIYIRPLLSG